MSGETAASAHDQPTGSPPDDESVFVAVGKLRRPHGVRGDILLEIMTDFPERLKPGLILYAGEERQELRIVKARQHDNLLILKFAGYVSPEQVSELTNKVLFIKVADIPPLPDGEYYHHQLIGMQVVDENNRILGNVTSLLETGANDVLVLRSPAGAELLLPWNMEFIHQVDVNHNMIVFHLIPGLLGEE